METIGSRTVIGNPEDSASWKVAEVKDIYEVAPGEGYVELLIYPSIFHLHPIHIKKKDGSSYEF